MEKILTHIRNTHPRYDRIDYLLETIESIIEIFGVPTTQHASNDYVRVFWIGDGRVLSFNYKVSTRKTELYLTLTYISRNEEGLLFTYVNDNPYKEEVIRDCLTISTSLL